MTEIKYKIGNLFDDISDDDNAVIAHCCNDLGRMGSGFVVPLYTRWPHVKSLYVDWYNTGYCQYDPNQIPFELGQTQFIRATPTVYVANMIGQHGVQDKNDPFKNPHPIRYDALESCIKRVGEVTGKRKLICPKFGSDRAGGSWPIIEEMILKHWCKKDLDVTIYSL